MIQSFLYKSQKFYLKRQTNQNSIIALILGIMMFMWEIVLKRYQINNQNGLTNIYNLKKEKLIVKLQKVSSSYAILNEKIGCVMQIQVLQNLGDGVLIDTQSDVKHAQMMMDLLSPISEGHPKFIINTHEDCDHVFGN